MGCFDNLLNLNDKDKIMEITTYKHNYLKQPVKVGENVKLSDAIEQVTGGEIEFFIISDRNSYLEIALSHKGDIIANGCKLF